MRVMTALALLVATGCQVNEVGPRVECVDCPAAIEPGAALEVRMEWFDEPCDVESRVAGPLVRYCTPVDVDRELLCDAGCDVTRPSAPPFEVLSVAVRDVGAVGIEARVTRLDTGEVHTEALAFDAAYADALALSCVTDVDGECDVRDSTSGERWARIAVEPTWRGQPIALDLSRVEGLERVRQVDVGRYEGEVDVTAGARTVTVRSAEASASVEVAPR